MILFRAKLGLHGSNDADEEIVAYLLHMMGETRADFTMTFRNLAEWSLTDMKNQVIDKKFWALKTVSKSSHFSYWRNLFMSRLEAQTTTDESRLRSMKSVNPRYVLRNWIAETAIRAVENRDTEYLRKVQRILRNPFVEQSEAEKLGFADPPPQWAKEIRVSCSS